MKPKFAFHYLALAILALASLACQFAHRAIGLGWIHPGKQRGRPPR